MNIKDVMRSERSEPNSERVAAIVKRAHREVATKDLLELVGTRIWIGLLNILGIFSALVVKTRRVDDDGAAERTSIENRETKQ